MEVPKRIDSVIHDCKNDAKIRKIPILSGFFAEASILFPHSGKSKQNRCMLHIGMNSCHFQLATHAYIIPYLHKFVNLSDVTFFRYNNYKYYICVIIDLFARAVVGYRISRRNSTQLAKSTFKSAYEKRQPPEGLLFHTDRGGNYISHAFRSYLQSLHATQSFSRAHVPYDNSVMEMFFSSMKREELYRIKYRSENEFKTAVEKNITFYNEKHPHAKNKYKTPAKKEADFFNRQAISP